MRHGNYKYKLSRDPAHRKALLKNLAVELIDHESITTTLAKAKAVKHYVEKLVTISRVDNLSNRRLIYAKLNNRDSVSKLFESHGPKYKTRPGGYTRLIRKSDPRVGDNSQMAVISFV